MVQSTLILHLSKTFKMKLMKKYFVFPKYFIICYIKCLYIRKMSVFFISLLIFFILFYFHNLYFVLTGLFSWISFLEDCFFFCFGQAGRPLINQPKYMMKLPLDFFPFFKKKNFEFGTVISLPKIGISLIILLFQ